MESRLTQWILRLWVVGVMIFLLAPLAIIFLYAFNPSNVQSWPINGLSLRWFVSAWHNSEIVAALWLSVRVSLLATVVAVLLGSMVAFAVHYFRFPGRDAASFIVVLPIALPGVVTGIALSSFFVFLGFSFSFWTIVIAHVTFCIVIVYNNVIARLRRLPGSLGEASMDLGADAFMTFRRVTYPMLSTALFSGALLAFALSFNEVIVTNFTAGAQNTLPLWIFGEIRLGHNLPEVNATLAVVIVCMILPLLISYRMMNRAPAEGGR